MDMDFAQLRQRMVDSQIRPVNVSELSVLSAFAQMPREAFVPKDKRSFAYADGRIELSSARGNVPARYMMPAAALARLIQLADIRSDDFILDIGAGTGYGAAVMAQLGSAVVALESDENLLNFAENLFSEYGCENITMIKADLVSGWTGQAPYDVIMLEGAVDAVPQALLAQLREGGRLVAAEGRGNAAFAYFYRRENGVISRCRAFNLALDTLPGFAAPRGFTF